MRPRPHAVTSGSGKLGCVLSFDEIKRLRQEIAEIVVVLRALKGKKDYVSRDMMKRNSVRLHEILEELRSCRL